MIAIIYTTDYSNTFVSVTDLVAIAHILYDIPFVLITYVLFQVMVGVLILLIQ